MYIYINFKRLCNTISISKNFIHLLLPQDFYYTEQQCSTLQALQVVNHTAQLREYKGENMYIDINFCTISHQSNKNILSFFILLYFCLYFLRPLTRFPSRTQKLPQMIQSKDKRNNVFSYSINLKKGKLIITLINVIKRKKLRKPHSVLILTHCLLYPYSVHQNIVWNYPVTSCKSR